MVDVPHVAATLMGVDVNAYVEGSVGQDPHEVAWESVHSNLSLYRITFNY